MKSWKALCLFYRCEFKYRQKTMEVQWLITGRYLLTFMANYRIVLSNLQCFIRPDIPLVASSANTCKVVAQKLYSTDQYLQNIFGILLACSNLVINIDLRVKLCQSHKSHVTQVFSFENCCLNLCRRY